MLKVQKYIFVIKKQSRILKPSDGHSVHTSHPFYFAVARKHKALRKLLNFIESGKFVHETLSEASKKNAGAMQCHKTIRKIRSSCS